MSNLAVYDVSTGWYGYSGGVESWHFGECNSAGGVSIRHSIKNNSSKVMKYVTIYFEPYNSVGDKVSTTIGNHYSLFSIKITGPVEAGENSQGLIAKNAWYNRTISSCRLVKAEIEYMDGTTESLSESQIDQFRPADARGCYVATAVYGSYDCPQVWTLRRYRDYTLAETWYGRAFIRTYYAISPTLVKWFGHTEWFKRMWRGKLDRMVADLQAKGVKDTPYEDRNW